MAKLQHMASEQQQHILAMVNEAENPAQRVMVERAVAAGRSSQEIAYLFGSMRGLSEVEILRGFTGSGIFQYYSASCVPTAFQIAIAELDPVYALRMRESPMERVRQQNRHLADRDGVPSPRVDEIFKDQQVISDHMSKNPDVKDFIETSTWHDEHGARNGIGIAEHDMLSSELHQQLEKVSGQKYRLHYSEVHKRESIEKGNSVYSDGRVNHAHIVDALDRGLPVVFRRGKHERVITGVHRGRDGLVYYVVSDPWTGGSTLEAKSSFDNRYSSGSDGRKTAVTVLFLPELF